MSKKKEKEKRGSRGAAPEILAQDVLPFSRVRGMFVERPDRSFLAAVLIEGANDSLWTYRERQAEGWAVRNAFCAIDHPAALIRLPKSVDSSEQIAMLDSQIARLRSEIFEEGSEMDPEDPRVLRLYYLENHIRPQAEEEALAGTRVDFRNYTVFEFEADYSRDAAAQEMRNFLELVLAAGHDARICDQADLLEMLQLYFTPKRINPKAVLGNVPVLSTAQEVQ